MIATAGALAEAAAGHGLRLRAESVKLDESGADFVVAHAVDEHGVPWVLRSARRPDVLARAAAERRALEVVRPRLPVAVPEWRVFSEEVIAYPRVEGEPAAVIDMEAGGYAWRFDETAPPAAFVDTLAAALAALHGIDPADAAEAGLPIHSPDEWRSELATRAERSREVLEVPESVWARWQRWIADDGCWPPRSVLIHGDLHPPHVLVDGEHRVTGLLDWTEAQVADPATDFALMYATLGGRALAELVAGYREAGGVTWARMEEHVVETWSAYPATIAAFALLTGEDAHRQLGQMLVDANARGIADSAAR